MGRWPRDPEGPHNELNGGHREAMPLGAVFSRRRGENLAKSPLSLNIYWRWPVRAQKFCFFLITFVIIHNFKSLRSLSNYICDKLKTIHPNPGPRSRDKTEEGKAARRQRRNDRREAKRQERKQLSHFKVV